MNTKNILTEFLLFILIAIVLYAMASFWVLNFNIFQWDENKRGVYLGCLVVVYLTVKEDLVKFK